MPKPARSEKTTSRKKKTAKKKGTQKAARKTVPKAKDRKAKKKPTAKKRGKKNQPSDAGDSQVVIQKPEDREIVQKKPAAALFLGKNSITPELAKEWLGWTEVKEGNYHLKDHFGNKVFLTNNTNNRPFNLNNCLSIRQDILRGNWQFNGESFSIGKTGLILNGQHTLCALVLAWQELTEEPEKWGYDDDRISIERAVVFGVPEDDTTVNTIDTAKPRDLTDVIFRSAYFEKVNYRDKKLLSRMTDHCIRMLWDRTGANDDAFSLKRTHLESLAFLDAHPRIIECVSYIFSINQKDEDKNREANSLNKIISPGYGSALLYLMGSSATDPIESGYLKSDNRHEGLLDWSNMTEAEQFFDDLIDDDNLKGVRRAMGSLVTDDLANFKVRCAVLCKAWDHYVNGNDSPSPSEVTPRFDEDEDGFKQLNEFPTVGGIDLAGSDSSSADPTEEEIEDMKRQIREEKGE